MKFENVVMLDVTSVDAPNIVSSESLEKRLSPLLKAAGEKEDIIRSLTGIENRRYWDEDTMPSEAATKAAVKLFEKTGIDKNKIGVLINTSVCKDYIEPSVASLVHGNLELSAECFNFDVGNACLAFLNGMQIAGNMLEKGQIDYALIVDGEDSRTPTEATINRLLTKPDPQNFRSQFATLTLGSGAVAMILSRADLHPEKPKFLGGVSLNNTAQSRLCIGTPDEMFTDTKNLLKEGLALALRTYKKAHAEFGWDDKVFDQYILHQVSAAHTNKLCELLGIAKEKVHKIYPDFGNIGPAAIPIALDKYLENNTPEKGSRLALLGIGSGLNCSMMELCW